MPSSSAEPASHPFAFDRPLDPGSDASFLSFGPCCQEILGDLRQMGFVAIVGPRRNGKTTLLRELSGLWSSSGGTFVGIDVATASSEELSERFYADLLQRLGSDGWPPDLPCDITALQRRLVLLAGRMIRPTVLAIDPIDALPFDTAYELLAGLRAVYQELAGTEAQNRLLFLLAGATSLAQLSLGPTSPLFPLARIHRIPALTAAETGHLLARGLEYADLALDPSGATAAHQIFGGDRELLQRAGAELAEWRAGLKKTPIVRADIETVAEDLLDEALASGSEWSLLAEITSSLKRNAEVLDATLGLLRSTVPRRRELAADIGSGELSGFLLPEVSGYRFRTPFHHRLIERLGDRFFADLLVLRGRWEEARELYREAKPGAAGRRLRLDADELFIALGTQLLDAGEQEQILHRLTEVLELAFGYEEASVLAVRGIDPEHFTLAAGRRKPEALPTLEIEKCLQRYQVRIQRLGGRRRWLVPLARRSGAERHMAWLVVLHQGFRREGSRLLPILPFLLFVQELLGEQQKLLEQQELQKITRLITATTDRDEILGEVRRASEELTGAEHSNILMPDGADLGRLKIAGRNAIQVEDSEGRWQSTDPSSPEIGVCGYAFAKGQPVVVDNARTLHGEPYRFLPWVPGSCSEAAIPIRYRDGTLGVINVESKIPYFFHAGHVNVLTQLADLAAIAISNAEKLSRAEHEATLSRAFGGIAHEIKSHSASATNNAGLLLSSLEEGWSLSREETAKTLRFILDDSRATTQVVDDFYWMARPGTALLEDEKVRDLVSEAVALAGKKLGGLALDWLRVEDRGAGEITVRCRPNLLRRAIANLLVNGVESVCSHGREPREGDVAVRLSCDTTAGKVLITITDRGQGLPEGEDVFAPYYTSKPGKGLGLGLSICKTVVEAHRGSVSARPVEHGGALFQIALPMNH